MSAALHDCFTFYVQYCRARGLSERAFGNVTKLYQVLDTVMKMSVPHVNLVTLTGLSLYNKRIRRKQKTLMNVPQETLNKIEESMNNAADNHVVGPAVATKMRDDMKLYFNLVDKLPTATSN